MTAEGKKSEAGSTEPPVVDLNTIGERLRWAIGQRPRDGRQRGVRKFQRDIQARSIERADQGERGIPGVTLPSIMTYLNDETEPSVEFLREAARVLAVREEWLAFGEGFPTAAENAAGVGFPKESPLGAFLGAMLDGASIRDELGKGSFGFWELPDAARESVIRGFNIYRRLPSALKRFGDAIPTTEALTARYASYLAAPFTMLGINAEALEPVERALLVDALLRPLDIVRWASRGPVGRVRGYGPPKRTPEEENLSRMLAEAHEEDDEAEENHVADEV